MKTTGKKALLPWIHTQYLRVPDRCGTEEPWKKRAQAALGKLKSDHWGILTWVSPP